MRTAGQAEIVRQPDMRDGAGINEVLFFFLPCFLPLLFRLDFWHPTYLAPKSFGL